MKKRVHAIVLVIAMIFSMFGTLSFDAKEAKADTQVTVKFHYTRKDNNYEGWNLWTWGERNESLTFNEVEATGVCATGTYSAATQEIGFVVRKSEGDNELTILAENMFKKYPMNIYVSPRPIGL